MLFQPANGGAFLRPELMPGDSKLKASYFWFGSE
jgi:hypothetical protein